MWASDSPQLRSYRRPRRPNSRLLFAPHEAIHHPRDEVPGGLAGRAASAGEGGLRQTRAKAVERAAQSAGARVSRDVRAVPVAAVTSRALRRWHQARGGEWRCHGTAFVMTTTESWIGDRRALWVVLADTPGPALETASADGSHVDGIVGTLSEETVANPRALPSASQLLPLTALSICVYLPPESGLASPERRPGKARRSRRPARST